MERLLLFVVLLGPLTGLFSEDGGKAEPAGKKAKSAVSLEYDVEGQLSLSLAGRDNEANTDMVPAQGTPRVDFKAEAQLLTKGQEGFSSGPAMRVEFTGKGEWIRSVWLDEVGNPLNSESWTYAWSLAEVNYRTFLGWVTAADKKAGRWVLDTGLVLAGDFNDFKKDVVVESDELTLDKFTVYSWGPGLRWAQKIGEVFVFEYSPALDVLYSSDLERPWIRWGLDLDLEFQQDENSKWLLSASQSFSNFWIPEVGMQSRFSGQWVWDRLQFRADFAEFEWSASWPEGNPALAVGQTALWSSGAKISWKAKDWTLALALNQPWWSLNRARVNDVQDKPFNLTLEWRFKGKE